MSSGTVNSGGSSMPPSNPVKVIKATPKSIQPPINSGPQPAADVPSKAKAAGAPVVAPAQTIVVTGQGATEKGTDAHPPQPPLAPQPPSNGSTSQIEAGPSVDYDAGQETPANVLRHPNAVIPLGEQDQRT